MVECRMVKANTGLLSLCVLVLGAACAEPIHDAPVPAPLKATRRALGEGPASQMVDVGTSADNALAPRPASLTAAGTTLLFSADDGTTGRELWRLTPVGPALLADISPGNASAEPSQLFYSRGLTWFSATNGQQGLELWRTDGTTTGTVMVKDIQPGPASSRPANFTEYKGWIFFSADDGDKGNELWRTDGTAAGTVRLVDLYLGAGDGNPRAFTEMDGQLYFTATGNGGTRQLWRTNGTPGGTVRLGQNVTVSSSATSRELVRSGRVIYFAGDNGTGGNELWKTDGTEEGTVRVKDILPGALSSDPLQLTVLGNAVYFVATDGTTGRELWKSDGTEAGTQRVLELTPGNNTVETPDSLVATASRLFFRMKDATRVETSLHVTDGTAAGTQKLVDFKALGGKGPLSMKEHGNTLYFTGSQTIPFNYGIEVWTSDGTVAGTKAIGNNFLPDSSTAPVPGSFTVWEDNVYFTAIAPGTGLDPDPAVPTLWRTRGTVATTRPVGSDLTPPPTRGSSPVPFVNWNGALYFTSFEPYAAARLWRTEGTAATTVALKDIVPKIELQFSSTQGLTSLTPLGDALYFAALPRVSTGYQLWKTGGTPATTTQVSSRVSLSLYDYPNPIELAAFGGALFFAGQDAAHGVELWKTDGTDAGTVLVKDLVPGGGSSTPLHFTLLGDALYFLVQDTSGGRALWKTDGTEAGTVQVTDIRNVENRSSVVSILGVLEDTLYFVAGADGTGYELWKTDGTSYSLVKDIAPGNQDSGPDHFTRLGDSFYFTATDGTSGVELWKSDGTEAGTLRVKDIYPGAGSATPLALTALGGHLYFTANDGTTGAELWKTDGTEAGTLRVKDILPGPRGGVLAEALLALPTEQLVLFAANDGVHGTELWRSDGTEAGTFLLHDIAPWRLGSEPSGFTFYGDSIIFSASDGRHGQEPWTMPRARLVNSVPPGITCPADQTVEAQQALGAAVDFEPAEATDDDPTLPPAVSYSHESGGLFLFGTTQVTATARDAAGLVASCTFNVTVQDTTPPEVFCPTTATVEATSAEGALVSFPLPWAKDAVTHQPHVDTYPFSGTVFPQGDTTVTVTATDDLGNSNQCTFTVSVRDTTASTLTCPADQLVEAEDASGAIATWPPAEASDPVSTPVLTYAHTSGERFPLGKTPVEVTARDEAGNVSRCTFHVIIRDSVAPTLKCPAAIELEATGPEGAPADFLVTNVVDNISSVTVRTLPSSGDTFPVGETSVRVLAEDTSGNVSECRFSVRVNDTLPPLLTCPQTVVVPEGPVKVTLPTPAVTDRVTPEPAITFSPASGSEFPLGDTSVEVTATDASGNIAQCTFTVHVEKAKSGCSAAPASMGASGWMGLLSLLAFAARRKARSSTGGVR
ncbi:HYR domain-containing protein [Melittangium boletus DSM 14713]|uniref:HYR domain-containing protein n=2 Tax=Melittangium boletus TaxID=83453 RepID=A0A286NUP1_9BACT|nr:HYR domain-containing protein [Melittangium boletus DSM 14713]